jgi:crotonobetainyl-CoA:carnitine CoA-transferase CaiB-like acyl-CoA transferase
MAPLSGISVVTIALNTPGPLAVARLAAEGARVTKVEPPGGDPLAQICAAWYEEMHAGMRVEQIDLKSPRGTEQMRELLAEADLFVSSQRPTALARLGLDATTLSHTRWVNIVGDQAHPDVAGHDLTYLAAAGLLGDTMPPSLFADVMGSERAFSAALLLLRQPVGTHAEVGLYDSLAPMVAPLRHGLTMPGGLLGGGSPAYNIYRAREGSVAIAALEPHFRKRLYAALQLPVDSELSAIMTTRSASEWQEWARAHDLPLAIVTTLSPKGLPH